jgi:hypothetical protein
MPIKAADDHKTVLMIGGRFLNFQRGATTRLSPPKFNP